jgi:thiol-disulfide isomerase/thioredoxin
MRSTLIAFSLAALLLSPAGGQDRAIAAPSQADVAAAARFEAVLREALTSLARAGSYRVDVQSTWGAVDEPNGPKGGGRYRLVRQGDKYRVEAQSQQAASPDLICASDGTNVTTYFPARKLYSQHAANSPQAGLEFNKMLALTLQGSALDILLQRDVAGFVRGQSSGLKDRGETLLDGRKTHCFEVVWAGAKVELWFAAEGDPLLVQFTRTSSVPTAAGQQHTMVCTAKFQWQLGERPPQGAFALTIPSAAQRVNEIYEALAGESGATPLDRPLPKLSLATLEGNDVELAAAADTKATVLIFWATWCAESVEDFPAIHRFVTAYKDRGISFYAVNVGEPPGEVRRFTAKHSLVSTVLLDPRSSASSALRISQLPAVAIIAPDNTVRAILHGTAKELQGELAAQLEALLTGRASTARRTNDEVGQAK